MDIPRFNRRRMPAKATGRSPSMERSTSGLMYENERRAMEPRLRQRHARAHQQADGNGVRWLWSPNNINQSVVGIKMSQPIANGWSLIGTVEAGFDPISGDLFQLAARTGDEQRQGGQSLQSASGDSSRAGQWDNSQFFLGLSNKTYGTLSAGRVNALSLDGLIAYDPMGSSYAFSPFGFTGMYAGFSDTELARSNTAIKYKGQFEKPPRCGTGFRSAVTIRAMAPRKCGRPRSARTFIICYGGTLSLDFVGSYAVDGALTSNFKTPIPKFYSGR